MPPRLPEFPLAISPPEVLDLGSLHPRIAEMVRKLLLNQQVLTMYDTGAVVLNYRGETVKAQLDKVGLDSGGRQP